MKDLTSQKALKPLPFVINHDRPVPLALQIADGVQRAIRGGYYEVGERLPNLDGIAEALGVGRQTAQGAVRELVNRGEVVARRKAGIRVRASDEQVFTNQVLYLRCGGNSFYFSSVNSQLATRMLKANIQMLPIDLTSEEELAGMPHVKAAIEGNRIALAIITGHLDSVSELCRQHNVPYINLCTPQDDQALAQLTGDDSAALNALAAAAQQAGIRHLGIVTGDTSVHVRISAVMAAHGVTTSHISTAAYTPDHTADGPESVEHTGFAAMQAFIASGQPWPDQLHFVDDYLARGGLTAMAWAGIDIPGTVRVSAHTNRGHTPVLPMALTRIETSPLQIADASADLVIDLLQDKRPRLEPVLVPATFVAGQTA